MRHGEPSSRAVDPSVQPRDRRRRAPRGRGAAVLGSGDHKTIGRVWIGARRCSWLAHRRGRRPARHRADHRRRARGARQRPRPPGLLPLPGRPRPSCSCSRSSSAWPRDRAPAGRGIDHRLPPGRGRRVLDLARRRRAARWSATPSTAGPAAAAEPRPESIAIGLLGLGLVVARPPAGRVCVVTTVIALRARRLSLAQVPLFSWSMLVAGGDLAALPAGVHGRPPAALHRPALRPASLFGQPGELFQRSGLGVRPAAGLRHGHPGPRRRRPTSCPVSAGVRQRHRGAMWSAIGAFGAFAFGAWAQPVLPRASCSPRPSTSAWPSPSAWPLLSCSAAWPTAPAKDRPALRPASVLSVLALWSSCSLAAGRPVPPCVIEPFAPARHHLGRSATSTWCSPPRLVGAVAALCCWAPKLWGRHVPGRLLAYAAGLLLVRWWRSCSPPLMASRVLDRAAPSPSPASTSWTGSRPSTASPPSGPCCSPSAPSSLVLALLRPWRR